MVCHWRKSPIRTPELLAANRANGRKSSGLRTAAGKVHARLNRLRHGRRSPLFARFWSALRKNPSKCRWVSQSLLGLEDTRHPLFARYLRLWGQLWARGHAYQLTVKRRWKRLQSLLTEQGTASLTREAETGGEFAHQPSGIGQRRRASRRELSSNSVSQSPKSIQEWRTPALEDDRSRNVAERKGDARKAVV